MYTQIYVTIYISVRIHVIYFGSVTGNQKKNIHLEGQGRGCNIAMHGA